MTILGFITAINIIGWLINDCGTGAALEEDCDMPGMIDDILVAPYTLAEWVLRDMNCRHCSVSAGNCLRMLPDLIEPEHCLEASMPQMVQDQGFVLRII